MITRVKRHWRALELVKIFCYTCKSLGKTVYELIEELRGIDIHGIEKALQDV